MDPEGNTHELPEGHDLTGMVKLTQEQAGILNDIPQSGRAALYPLMKASRETLNQIMGFKVKPGTLPMQTQVQTGPKGKHKK